MNRQQERDVNRKLKCLRYAEVCENVAHACRKFGISRETFYVWKREFLAKGPSGLINKKPCHTNLKRRVRAHIEEKILHLRSTYHFGPVRIVWYLKRYHDIAISTGGVYQVLKRHGMTRLPEKARKRSIKSFHLYEKRVPGHHVQIDVKFLEFKAQDGKPVKRFQYTAFDDATRIRALKIYPKHNQKCAIQFVDYVVKTFPFRIHTIRTDNGHEFQAKFHWHVEDLGMIHTYIKPRTPRLNGKVERSHLTDDQEFYQLLNYKDDVDLAQKLTEWEAFYNFMRPHGAHKGKTPYEALRDKLAA
jgi:transposase InsO family protein